MFKIEKETMLAIRDYFIVMTIIAFIMYISS
jgi:hypothetical protein